MYISFMVNNLEGMSRYHMHSAQSVDYMLPGGLAVINTGKLVHRIQNSSKRHTCFGCYGCQWLFLRCKST